ncbi:Multidrug resistance transporter, Bcr/CflA family protein [Minicystis rosea]|nr:Multidrug resistance transporter, Bcr/CflA family protein [Minicystis rosea]
MLPETAQTRTPRLDVGAIGGGLRSILRDRGFLAFTMTGAFSQAGMFAYISGSPFVLIELFHVAPQKYGLIFGTNAFGLIAGSQINHRLLTRYSPGQILARATMSLTAAGLLLLAVAVSGWGGLWGIVVALFLFLANLGFIGSNAIALAMDKQGARAGLASAALGALQFAVSAGGSSLVGVLNDGSARPMAAVMAVCAVASWGRGWWLCERGGERSADSACDARAQRPFGRHLRRDVRSREVGDRMLGRREDLAGSGEGSDAGEHPYRARTLGPRLARARAQRRALRVLLDQT